MENCNREKHIKSQMILIDWDKFILIYLLNIRNNWILENVETIYCLLKEILINNF